MSRRTRSNLSQLAIPVLLFGMLAALPAAAEPKEWDQAAVTKIAQELATAVGDLRETVRKTPAVGDVTLNPQRSTRRLRQEALDDLRVVGFSADSLARRLEAGEGREETYPSYRRIRGLRNRIARHARLATLQETTVSKLDAARALLEQLEPYYEAEESG